MAIPEGVRKFGGSYYIDLNRDEIAELDRPVNGSGGAENFIRRLQSQKNHSTGAIRLSAEDLADIPRHAFDYGQGGFENRLIAVFGRILGVTLGREDEPAES